jgi:hypothetical protein
VPRGAADSACWPADCLAPVDCAPNPAPQYANEVPALQQRLSGLSREELQRALGVKPMDRSSKYRGVSKKKGRWEAKVRGRRARAGRGLGSGRWGRGGRQAGPTALLTRRQTAA